MTVPIKFDAGFYQAVNPDLAAAGLTTEEQLYKHFQTFGINEGRLFSPLVDLKFYKSNYSDLAKLTNEQAFQHLQEFGIAEGRICSPLVDINFYEQNNADLADFNNEQAFQHLQEFGIGEGRRLSPHVDIDFYLANNPDVLQAYGGDRSLTLQHIERYGIAEGRSCSPTFKFDSQLKSFVSADATNVVIDWNQTTLNAIGVDKTAPPIAARTLAMVHAAIYDAVNAIAQTNTFYKAKVEAPAFASPEAAAAAAAHRVLVNLFPTQTATFDAAIASSLSEIPDSKSETDGIALGQTVADRILALRSNDGSKTQVSYTPVANPGIWVTTPPGFQSALLPQWPDVIPFAMTNGSQFRPLGPPSMASAEYAAELNQVKEQGGKNSASRTPEQTEIAKFWADGAGTYTPPGHWNAIAESVSLKSGNTLVEDARLFAQLNIALADAAIASWDAKYAYNCWRPVTAIRQADTDGNPQTTADPTWDPLIGTPPFPEYTSGHSTFSGAADAVLTEFFGDDFNFTATSMGLPGVSREFDSFSDAADEAGISRIYGGIHFLSANEDGLATGRALGKYVVDNFF